MADSSDERMGSSSKEINGRNPNAISSDESQSKKTCAACGTSKTPLWRGGPAGPKSLCNACGIKSRKKRGPVIGAMKENTEVKQKKKKKKKKKRSQNGGGKSRFMGLGREGLVKILMVDGVRRKLGEEEEAAVLLMALSGGYSVYA